MLVRGPIDASVGSLERLSYEGEAVVGKNIERLPRDSTVTGGTGLLCVADLLAYADLHASQERFDELVNAAKNDPALLAESEALKAAHRAEHIAAGRGAGHCTARRRKRVRPRRQGEAIQRTGGNSSS